MLLEDIKQTLRPYHIIGYIDGYDAVHYKVLKQDEWYEVMHCEIWPSSNTNNRFRFWVDMWNFDTTSKWALSDAQRATIESRLRRAVTPPGWVIANERWEAAGRPHGAEFVAFLKEYKKKYGIDFESK